MPEPGDPLQQFEAEYALERPVACPHCRRQVQTLLVVRMLRNRVNFTSVLPRRGQVLICPECRTIVPGELSGLL
jgi:hypothetical protein